jgi:hypothetical protein
MATVFIGGSRAVSRLNEVIRDQLDDLIARQCTIFIGDANGADKMVQEHFAHRGYADVIVYCMDKCRNNVGSWSTRQSSRPKGPKDFAYYAAKDLAMAQDAHCGVMLWDARSKGTLNNIQQLVSRGKKTLVYFAPERTFYKLTSQSDLERLLARCNSTLVASAQRQIKIKLGDDAQLSLRPELLQQP